MFDPNDNEFLNVYSEERDEELGIDYLESAMEGTSEVNRVTHVESPITRNKSTPRNRTRDASPQVCNHYNRLGVSSIIFNMSNGSTYELVITKKDNNV